MSTSNNEKDSAEKPRQSQSSFRFTVLSGIHRGVSTTCPGSFSIGGDESNNVQLKDSVFHDTGLNITINSLESSNGFNFELSKDGKPLSVGFSHANERLYLKIGDVAVVLSDIADHIENNDLSKLSFATVTLNPGDVGPDVEPREGDTADNDQELTQYQKNKKYKQEKKARKEAIKNTGFDFDDDIDWEATEALRTSWFKRFTTISLVALVSLIVWYYSSLALSDVEVAVDESEIIKKCLNRIDNRVYKALRYHLKINHYKSKSKENIYRLTGPVNTLEEKEKLAELVKTLPCKPDWNLIIMEDEIGEIELFLAARHDGRVTLSSDPKHNRIVLQGFVANQADWENSLKIIDSMLNERINMLDNVRFTDDVEVFVQETLDQHELTGYVILSRDKDNLLVANMVFQPDLVKQWKQLHERYKKVFLNAPDIHIDEISLGVLGIRAVSMGEQPRIVLSNGQTYLIGSIFPNGAVLTNIERDSVTLETLQGKVKYPVSQKEMAKTIKDIAERNETRFNTSSPNNLTSTGNLPAWTPREADKQRAKTAFSQQNAANTNPSSSVPSMQIISDYFVKQK